MHGRHVVLYIEQELYATSMKLNALNVFSAQPNIKHRLNSSSSFGYEIFVRTGKG
jgi:hypothetical protein